MKNSLKTRREFLRTSALGAALAWTIPQFLDRTFYALHAAAVDRLTQVTTGKDAPILVVLQMAGGNDGLNTVIPFEDDAYYRARPTLAIDRKAGLKLGDNVALAPVLEPLERLFGEGHLAIVQGVGYPNPNRSHFRSTEIWETASDANQTLVEGWLGRYFDNCCGGEDVTVGVAIGNGLPQSFAAKEPIGVAFNGGQQGPRGRKRLEEESESQIAPELAETDVTSSEGGTISSFEGASPEGDSLAFIQRTALNAAVSAERIRAISQSRPSGEGYPQGRLGSHLSLIARLIDGGMPTRVYYASQGGYDTHNNQSGTHQRLLSEMGEAVAAFLNDLKLRGHLDRVVLMTFSEFGRRVVENGSGGTDHGAAAPLFLAGGGVQGGLYGVSPSLTNLDRGDLIHGIDFRSVYATILAQWLRVEPVGVLGKTFPQLPLVTSS